MTFVYPLLLGGLLLAGLPVLLHFLIRQKPKTLVFPAFRFLMQKRRSNTRNLRLRHLLLLLLRVALLALICLALARPRLFQEQIGISRERPVALALVFDTSASMGYKSGDATRLDLAKKRCLELLDQLPEDCRVLVLDSSDAANYGRVEWLKSLEMARQRIKTLAVRPDSTPVTRAIDEAERRFAEWDRVGDDPDAARLPRMIGVFTDRTRASWDPSAIAKREPQDDAVKVRMMLFDVGVDDPVDLAITQIELPAHELGGMRQSFAAGEKIKLAATLRATGKGADTVVTLIGLLANPDKLAVPLEAGEHRKATFEIDTRDWKPGLYQAEVKLEIENDQLPFNNRWFVTFEIRQPQRLLLLVDDAKKESTFENALKACLYAVDKQSASDAPPDLSKYDGVFLDGVAKPSDKLWTALTEYVQKGHGLGIIPGGDAMKSAFYNSADAQKLMPATIKEKTAPAAEHWGRWNDAAWDLDHPFLHRYEGWFTRANGIVSNLRGVLHYWEVAPFQEGSVLIRYDDDRPAIVERIVPKGGTVLLLTTPMEPQTPEWNNYASRLYWGYPALTMLCARHLCPESRNPTLNYQFGKSAPTVAHKPGYDKYLLTGPGVSEEIRMDSDWVGDRLPSAGSYTLHGVTNQDKVALAKFSINVAGAESDLTRVPISDIEAVLGSGAVVPQDRKTALPKTLNWDEPIELFPWLMLALLFLLALENLLANKFYRQEEPAAA